MRITREKCRELFKDNETRSIQFAYKDKTVGIFFVYIYPSTFGVDGIRKSYTREYFDKEVIFESNLFDLEAALDKISKYGIFEDGYSGKTTINWNDPDEIPEPPLDEVGILITKEEILEILEKDIHAYFNFKRESDEVQISHRYKVLKGTRTIDEKLMDFIVTIFSDVNPMQDKFFKTMEEVFIELENLNVIVDGKAYVYSINDDNPICFLDETRNI